VGRWEENVQAAELRLIALSPATLMGATITAAVAIPALWLYLDHALVFAWAASMLGLTSFRLILWRGFRRIAADDAAVIAWQWPIIISVATSGALWGLFGISFYLVDDAEIRGVVLFLLASMLASGTIFYSACLRAHNGYVFACALPIAVASFWHGTTTSILFGCISLAYIALILRAAHAFNASITRTIRLQLENAALVGGLKAAKESAEQANRSKSQFLANMSHELRTPLNAVIGYSEMLVEDAVAEGGGDERVTDLKRIHAAGRHLLALVNDVLDMSKIEAGRMEMLAAPIELHAFLSDVAATATTLIESNKNELVLRCAEDLGSIVSDATKLRQVMLNLLGNAAKFTRAGRITVTATREQGTTGDWIGIAVADTGIGIDRQALGKLFTDFTQAEPATQSKYGGTGLGLALSRRLARLMGGDIAAESEPGCGSCFTLHLPALAPEDVCAHPEDRMIEKMGDRVIETLGVSAKLQAS
jgi:signal transduction histidine kinase